PRGPKRLIVDVSNTERPLTEIDALADACEPGVTVVVIGASHDIGLFRRLVRLGVSDYVAKPLTLDLVRDAIAPENVAPSVGRGTTGRSIAVAGARGGVGASTIAAGLGRLLAADRRRHVVIVDLDVFGGTGCLQLGVDPGGLADALANVSRLDAVFLERVLVQAGPRLFVLGAQSELDRDVVLATEALDALVAALEREFHYVIIDLPRRPGEVFAWALRRAAVRLLVMDRTVASVRDGKRMLDLVAGSASRSLVILNDDQPRRSLQLSSSLVEEALDRPVDVEIGYDAAAVSRLDNLGEAGASARSPLASGLAAVAGSLLGQAPRPRSRWPWRGWR
ncbi:MAG: hypothetical protein AAFX81_16360, partial [Pseudomonadota bacterium]